MSIQTERANDINDLTSGGPGAALKARREKDGHSLEAVEKDTRITRTKLAALEADDYAKVGSHTFVTGYIRQYAKWLGADGDQLVRAFETAVGKAPLGQRGTEQSERASAEKIPAKRLPLLWMIAGFLVLWVLVALVLNNSDEGGSQQNAAPSGDVEAEASAGSPPVAAPDFVREADNATVDRSPATAPVEVPQTELPQAEEVPRADTLPEPVEPTVAQESAPVESDARGVDAAFGGANSETVELATLSFRFSGDCWVEVRDASGAVLIAQLQQAGDNPQLSGQPPFKVMLGNARAAALEINGQPVDTDPGGNRDTLRLSVSP